MKDYVDKLTELRIDNDIEQWQIAELLNVQQSAISKYEKKKTRYKIEDVIKLCRFYQVSADWLLGLTDDLSYPKGK